MSACWVVGCGPATLAVSNPWKPLVSPLETCRAHLGDLMGNAAKAALPFADDHTVTLQVREIAA